MQGALHVHVVTGRVHRLIAERNAFLRPPGQAHGHGPAVKGQDRCHAPVRRCSERAHEDEIVMCDPRFEDRGRLLNRVLLPALALRGREVEADPVGKAFPAHERRYPFANLVFHGKQVGVHLELHLPGGSLHPLDAGDRVHGGPGPPDPEALRPHAAPRFAEIKVARVEFLRVQRQGGRQLREQQAQEERSEHPRPARPSHALRHSSASLVARLSAAV